MLEFTRLGDDRLALRGRWGSDSIGVQLRRVDESKFLLLNRGFHWIQSYPCLSVTGGSGPALISPLFAVPP